jgi:hypothetical protein
VRAFTIAAAAFTAVLTFAVNANTLNGFDVEFHVVTKGITVAATRWSLRDAGLGTYQYESHSETRGMFSLVRTESITERSHGHLIGGSLRPDAYSYDRDRDGDKRQVQVRFNWHTRTAHNSVKGDTWSMAVPIGTHDKLSYLLSMMQDLRQGKQELRYTVADGGTLKQYSLEIIGDDEIETDVGKFTVTKVKRTRASGKRETVFWCAQALGYFPVLISHRESDGTTLQLRIQSATGLR